MPLAGSMKLKTFLALAGLGVVGLGGLAWAMWPGMPQPSTSVVSKATKVDAVPAEAPPTEPPPALQDKPTQAAAATSSPYPNTSAADRAIARYIGKAVPGGKKKDITSGQSVKVNVYMDDGHAVMNRAKLDLDRDDKWDEKWTFLDGGGIQRQVAPADDEDYSETYVWDGAAWVPEA